MAWTRGRLVMLGACAAVYTFILVWYHCPYAGGSDSSGYLNSAQLMLDGRLSTPLLLPAGMPADLLPADRFTPLGFRLDAAGQNLLPSYPVGLPLHFAFVGWFIGLGPATTVVGVASALAFAFLLYFLGVEFGLRPEWSLSVALLGALSPLTITYALQPMSDLLAAVWVMAAILCALRASRHVGWAGAAGAAFAVAVLVRPTNALIILPAIFALHPSIRTWLAFGLGGLPGALFLAAYNHALYGDTLASGYGDISSLFAARHVPVTLWHYAQWVPVVATPLVFAGLALPWTKIPWRRQAVLLSWGGLLLGFYAFYECTFDAWWYLRFILPALPALALAAALVMQRIPYPIWFLTSRLAPPTTPADVIARSPVLRLPLTVLLFAGAVWWMLEWDRTLRVTKVELDERTYALTAKWIREELPPHAVLVGLQISGNAFHYCRQPALDQNFITPEDYARLNAWLTAQGRVLCAVLHDYEEPVLGKNLPGRWEVVTRLRQATVWRRLDPGDGPAFVP